MDSTDTAIGGGDPRFRTTHWSLILAAADPAHPRYRQRWEELAARYWKPVYVYVRVAWRKSSEDAKDLTQDFFVYLLDKDTLSRLRPELGSFRAYLRRALAHFLIDAERYRKARAAGEPVVRIDAAAEHLVPDAPDGTPEAAFDREWSRGLLKDALDELKDELARRGRQSHWEVFDRYCAGGVTYEALGAGLGIDKADVRNRLAYVRGELQRILRVRIREYVTTEEEVEQELGEVLRG